MKQLFNGFQCDTCRSIYRSLDEALECEQQIVETPLLSIGGTIIDDSYLVEYEMKVCKIYYEGHQVNYRMEWDPERNGEWQEVYTIHGNETLNDYL